MKVFISWSGDHSHRVALILRDWLPAVLQNVDTWVSSEDIPKGAIWVNKLGVALEGADFGIVCLVPGNLDQSWIIFEAGAMFRELDESRVCPLLVGIERKDIQGPLALFQNTIVNESDVRKLVLSINNASTAPIDENRLNRTFSACWPDLARRLEELEPLSPASNDPPTVVAPAVGDLPEMQVAVLVFLGEHPRSRLATQDIAMAISQHETRAQYHIDQLIKADLVRSSIGPRHATNYDLADAGRAYLVERGLI